MIKKYSVNIFGHQTSISLEVEFWMLLNQIKDDRGLSLGALLREIDSRRVSGAENLSSAIRIYILNYLRDHPTFLTKTSF